MSLTKTSGRRTSTSSSASRADATDGRMLTIRTRIDLRSPPAARTSLAASLAQCSITLCDREFFALCSSGHRASSPSTRAESGRT